MFDAIRDYIIVFFISMLPIIELRGAIPVGIAMGMPTLNTFIVAIIGNILPVPFLLLFGKKMLEWLATWKHIGFIFEKILVRAENRSEKIGKYQFIGLMLFVGIPLPGTGVWMGSVIATLLRVRIRSSFFALSLGVVIAGIIMSLASAGLLGVFNTIFSFGH